MEHLNNGLDFILWPSETHKRLSAKIPSLIPMVIIVGVLDVLSFESILNDHILKGGSALKILLAILTAVFIGFVDTFSFAWPIADLCRYIARRTEKFITPGFHIILMKSYALSYLVFIPYILLATQFGDKPAIIGPGFASYELLAIIVVFWQLAILMRTISVKTKLEYPAKLIPAVCMYFWLSFQAYAVGYLLQLAYNLMGSLDKI